MIHFHNILVLWVVLLGFFATGVYSKTNSQDVSALNVMYNSFQSRSKLKGWKSSGGDPCGESWKGITCSGSSVTEIDLADLGLSGSMGYQLASLTSVTRFDLSKNNLNGDIPYQLPPSAKYIDLSQNGFSNTVPYSVSQMSGLETLNLGRNKLNGQLSDMFGKLTKLKELQDGPLTYLSVTIFENCSPEKLRDFYMDNDYRKQWDKMLIQHEQLQMDKNNGVEVGWTIKKFPLLTAREYVLAWRLWEGKDKTFYCFIKECEHPLAPRQKKYVRVRTFRSGWRIRKVPSTNACEIKMFHQEDAGLNVEMAKLAFSRGIWSYVCKMGSALNRYSTISSHQSSSAASAVTLIKRVPPGLEATDEMTSQATSVATSVCRPTTGEGRKLSRTPSTKLLANGLLLLGGVVCLSRGHSSLGAKVAMAYILTKWSKRGASSSQRSEISGA